MSIASKTFNVFVVDAFGRTAQIYSFQICKITSQCSVCHLNILCADVHLVPALSLSVKSVTFHSFASMVKVQNFIIKLRTLLKTSKLSAAIFHQMQNVTSTAINRRAFNSVCNRLIGHTVAVRFCSNIPMTLSTFVKKRILSEYVCRHFEWTRLPTEKKPEKATANL